MNMRDSIKGAMGKLFQQENPLLEDYHPFVEFAGTTPEQFLQELGNLNNEELTAKIFETILVLDQEQVIEACKNSFNNPALYACHALTTTNIHGLDLAFLKKSLEYLTESNFPTPITLGLQFMIDLVNNKLIDLLKQREESTNDYYINLSGSYLRGMDLSNQRLSNINLTCCNINNTQLEATTLSGAILYDTSFKSSNLSRAVLVNSKILHSNFSQCNLKYAAISDTQVDSCNFKNADLSGAALTGCEFLHCLFKETVFLDPRPELDIDTLNAYIKYLNDLKIPNSCIYFNISLCIDDGNNHDNHSLGKKRYDRKTRLVFWQEASENDCFSKVSTPAWEPQATSKNISYLFANKSSKQKIESKIKKIKEILHTQHIKYTNN